MNVRHPAGQTRRPALGQRDHRRHEMERHGPCVDADAAEAMARRLLRFGRALTSSSGGKHG